MTNCPDDSDRTRNEEIEVKGSELVARVEKLVREGNVRRLIIKKSDGDVLVEVPLTAGAVVGGTFILIAPVLAALSALAALLVQVRIEIVRTEAPHDE